MKENSHHGRQPTVRQQTAEIRALFARGISKRQIANRLSISRALVRRMPPLQRTAPRAPQLRGRTRPQRSGP